MSEQYYEPAVVPATFQPAPQQTGLDDARPVQQEPVRQETTKEVGYGTIDQILAAPDISTEDMYVPEWGCKIKLRGLTKAQQHAIRKEASVGMKGGEPNPEKVEMLMFLSGVVEPQFGREHYHQLMQKSTGVIDRILQKLSALSGVDASALERAKAEFQG